jgi:transcriptional regulator with XRE-family HTH domain
MWGNFPQWLKPGSFDRLIFAADSIYTWGVDTIGNNCGQNGGNTLAVNKRWGESLLDLRKRHGLSVRDAEVASGAPVSSSYINNWEKGLLPPEGTAQAYLIGLVHSETISTDEAIYCLREGGYEIPLEFLTPVEAAEVALRKSGKLDEAEWQQVKETIEEVTKELTTKRAGGESDT